MSMKLFNFNKYRIKRKINGYKVQFELQKRHRYFPFVWLSADVLYLRSMDNKDYTYITNTHYCDNKELLKHILAFLKSDEEKVCNDKTGLIYYKLLMVNDNNEVLGTRWFPMNASRLAKTELEDINLNVNNMVYTRRDDKLIQLLKDYL